MAEPRQPSGAPRRRDRLAAVSRAAPPLAPPPATRELEAERAARATLRAQIAKLENELSTSLAERFPFLAAPRRSRGARPRPVRACSGLASSSAARPARRPAAAAPRAPRRARGEHERRARELLERMQLEPGRYKYVRVPVGDLGEGGCGVWEVRPRLGLIGMLAGWWQLKLSSGCPLAAGPRSGASAARAARLAVDAARGR